MYPPGIQVSVVELDSGSAEDDSTPVVVLGISEVLVVYEGDSVVEVSSGTD